MALLASFALIKPFLGLMNNAIRMLALALPARRCGRVLNGLSAIVATEILAEVHFARAFRMRALPGWLRCHDYFSTQYTFGTYTFLVLMSSASEKMNATPRTTFSWLSQTDGVGDHTAIDT